MDLGEALDEAKKCPYCMGNEAPDVTICGAYRDARCRCTRNRGHTGKHMACNFGQHPMTEWENE